MAWRNVEGIDWNLDAVKKHPNFKSFLKGHQNKILVGSSLGLINFDLETDRSYLLLNKRIKKIAPLNDSTFYILTNDSIYKLNYF